MISVQLAGRWELAAEQQIAQGKTADKPRLCKKTGFLLSGEEGRRASVQPGSEISARQGYSICNAKLPPITWTFPRDLRPAA